MIEKMWTQLLVAFLLVQVFQCAHTKKTLPSQFEASCPSGCRCDRATFECRDLGETTTEIFHHALPSIYPDLDSLVITGNDFKELVSENIFTGNDHHEHLSYMNLSDNGITSFGAQTFIGSPRVEYFYLANNKINAFIDQQPLKYLTSLKLLDLTSALDERTSPRRRADLLRSLFDSDHDFIDLNEIILTSNHLEHIHTNTFCRVKGLTRLILKDNSLNSLDFDDGCLASISLLDLRKNRFFSVPSTLWKRLQLLNSFDLSLNPLHCDCTLQDFHQLALDESIIFLAQQETTCASPKQVRGKSIFDLEDNFCRGRASFFHWFVLLLVGGAVIFGYRWLRKSGRQIKLPSMLSGYTQLKSSDESASSAQQPAFV
ncbi:LRRCT domain-containing protein [Aphelenchoides bicaudatus]|nr:LRRCT domain-containing protein [Aphelenchoides bicaudatus]